MFFKIIIYLPERLGWGGICLYAQADLCEFQTNLVYTVNSRAARTTVRPGVGWGEEREEEWGGNEKHTHMYAHTVFLKKC